MLVIISLVPIAQCRHVCVTYVNFTYFSEIQYMGSADGTFSFTLAFFEDEAMTTSFPTGAEIAV